MNQKLIWITLAGLTFSYGCNNDNKQNQLNMKSKNAVEFLNPDGLHKNPAFSQVVTTEGAGKTIYVGGQNSVDKDGNVIGKGDIEAQAKQVLKNLEIALSSGGATLENVINWNVYVVQGQPLESAFKVFQKAMTNMKNPPTISMIYVAGLGNPDFLMEMNAIAIIPEQ